MNCEFTKEELKLMADACYLVGQLFNEVGADAHASNRFNFKDKDIVSKNLLDFENRRWILNNKLQSYIAKCQIEEK